MANRELEHLLLEDKKGFSNHLVPIGTLSCPRFQKLIPTPHGPCPKSEHDRPGIDFIGNNHCGSYEYRTTQGALDTARVLTAGLVCFRQEAPQLGQKLILALVVAQDATAALMVGTAYYYGDKC